MLLRCAISRIDLSDFNVVNIILKDTNTSYSLFAVEYDYLFLS
jgi:hypothetical protein